MTVVYFYLVALPLPPTPNVCMFVFGGLGVIEIAERGGSYDERARSGSSRHAVTVEGSVAKSYPLGSSNVPV